jgi:hypothetical protein
MFFEVKILDGKGKVKKVVTSRELSRKFWTNFQTSTGTGASTSDLFKKRGRKSKKASLGLSDHDAETPSHLYDE